MRSLLAPFVLVPLALVGGGCGGSREAANHRNPQPGVARAPKPRIADPTQEVVPRYPGVPAYPWDDDGDNDSNDDENIKGFGRPADPATERAMVATLRRYFAAAANRDGAQACAMLSPSVRHAVPIEYGRYGASYMRGNTCAAVLSRTFEYLREQIVSEAAKMKVIAARLEGEKGYVVVHPHVKCVPSTCILDLRGELPIAKLLMRREAGSWKVESILLKV